MLLDDHIDLEDLGDAVNPHKEKKEKIGGIKGFMRGTPFASVLSCFNSLPVTALDDLDKKLGGSCCRASCPGQLNNLLGQGGMADD